VVELSDEETVAVLAETFTESLSDLGDRTRRVAVLKRIHDLLDQRIFCRLVMGIPADEKHYNVLFVFYVDPHRYRPGTLARFDEAAKRRLEEATSFDTVASVDEYLDANGAFTADDIQTRIDRLVGY
jgi:hypothetical protein